jgi:uncharacterized protein (DUF2236 family)
VYRPEVWNVTPQRGFFAPESVTWRLHADPGMWLAGVRALYLQALHPRAVRGVLRHSTFRHDPIGRLTRTARFVAIVTYAPRERAERAAARVRRIHAGLCADDPDDGTPFRLDDPALLRWVHCAETASYVDVVRRSGFPLSDADVDTYVDEQRTVAELVGLDRRDVPKDAAELAGYFDGVRPVLRATAEAQEIYAFLTAPPMPPELSRRVGPLGGVADAAYGLASRQGWQRVSRVAYSALPGWATARYGHPAYPAAATTAALRALCGAARLVPRGLRARLVDR